MLVHTRGMSRRRFNSRWQPDDLVLPLFILVMLLVIGVVGWLLELIGA